MINQQTSSKTSKITALLIPLLVLSACNSTENGGAVDQALDVKKQTSSQLQIADGSRPLKDELQDTRAICPKTVLRQGTESYNEFTKGVLEDEPGSSQDLRYRASITEHVRECNSAGEFLNIDVGIRGRILSGPKGVTGAFILPLRIVVVRGTELLYEKTHEVWTEILPGRSNGAFSYVDKSISILKPQSNNVQIFVGFDEGEPKKEDSAN